MKHFLCSLILWPICLGALGDNGVWANAVDANLGGAKTFVNGPWNASYGLGTYGVDTNPNTAWAVINHASDFAVGPLSHALQVMLTVTSAHGTPSPATTVYPTGTVVNASVDAVVMAGTTQRYVCTGFSASLDGSTWSWTLTNNPYSWVITADTWLQWNWQTQYYLATAANNSGGSVDVAGGWYNDGASVTVTATAASGYVFTGWTGDVVTAGNPLALTMSRAYAVTALFVPTTTYVDAGYSATNAGGHVYGDNAFSSIQAAVNAVQAGGTVQVADGVYNMGSTSVGGMPTRVALSKAVTVQSLNGPAGAVIVGRAESNTNAAYYPNGPSAVRCAYVGAGAQLRGFTLRGGSTMAVLTAGVSPLVAQDCGGGVYAEAGGLVADCIIEGNTAFGAGGGAFLKGAATTLRNCRLSDNVVFWYEGGGAYVTGSDVPVLPPPAGGVVDSCTLSGNGAVLGGVGGLYADHATVLNTIVWGNDAAGELEYYQVGGTFDRCCTMPLPAGSGNIAADPKFLSPDFDNYGLAGSSPCVDAGLNEGWMAGAMDLEGQPRVQDGNADGTNTVDIGAVESGPAPKLTVLANGSEQPLAIAAGQRVQIVLTANHGRDNGVKDWWILAASSGGWYYYDLASAGWKPGFQATYQGPFMSLDAIPVMDTTGLPAGTYLFYFGVDSNPNGLLDLGSLNYGGVAVQIH